MIRITKVRYLGWLCKRGHDYKGSGKSLRLKKTYDCIICHRIRSNDFFHQNKIKEVETRKKWKVNNKGKVLEMSIKYRKLNRELIASKSKQNRKELKDFYVIERLKGRKNIQSNLLNVLVEAKRMELLIKRKLKEVGNV